MLRKVCTFGGMIPYAECKNNQGKDLQHMGDLTTGRTPHLIAAEINTIRHQTEKILLAGAIEVGRRLREAKELLPHGEWLKWLEESVNYTDRTAQKLMRVFDAYGSQPSVSAGTAPLNAPGPEAQALPNLSYTQAFILLGVPEEERTQFIAELDLESMSTRQLEKAVQERRQAVEDRDRALEEKTELQETVEDQGNQIDRLTKELDSLKIKNGELSKSQAEVTAKVGRLSVELKSQKESTSAKAITRMSNNLNAAYHRAKANQIAFLYESMVRNYRELLYEMKEFAAKEPETYEVYRNKIMDFLAKGVKERI